MGRLAKGICYESAQDAINAMYSSVSPSVAPGSPAYLYQTYQWQGDNEWFVRKQNLSTGAVVDYWVNPASLPVCDPSQPLLDGVAVGWGIVLAMCVGFGAALIKRELK